MWWEIDTDTWRCPGGPGWSWAGQWGQWGQTRELGLRTQPSAPAPCAARLRRQREPPGSRRDLSLCVAKGNQVVADGSWPQVLAPRRDVTKQGPEEGEPDAGHLVVSLFIAFPAGEGEASRLAWG